MLRPRNIQEFLFYFVQKDKFVSCNRRVSNVCQPSLHVIVVFLFFI